MQLKFFWQRMTRGWDDSDTWALDSTIAEFALPRIKRLKELTNGYPSDLTPEEWDAILDKMMVSFTLILDENEPTFGMDPRIQEGLDLFAKYFRGLWW